MQYIIMKVHSKELNNQKVLHTFFSDYISERRTGLLLKFNNSLGFRDVANQFDDINGNTVWRLVDTPKDYQSPVETLLDGIYWLNDKNEVATFIVPNKDMVFDKYGYNTLEMMIKFQSFLYKVFGDKIRIEFKLGNRPKLSLKSKVLSYVYCTMTNGEYYCCEMSLPKFLKDKEIDYIINIMKGYVTFDPVIEQYECETCKEYHKEYPIHFEFSKRKTLERLYNTSLELGYLPEESVIEALERR